MKVSYSGWSEKYGSFNYNVFIDEKKTDYEIRFDHGQVYKQADKFQWVTADWNCDGDVYDKFGAYFDVWDKNGEPGSSRVFLTPQEMVSELVEGLYGDHYPRDNYVVSISGISVPALDKKPSLHEQVARTELQRLHQDIECNRKMKALGIRGPGEPWAR